VRAFWRYIAPVSLLVLCAALASAQTSADIGIGFGSAHDSANTNPVNTSGWGCATGANCLPTLSGLFMGFGADVMLNKRYGIGTEVSFQPTRTDYGTFAQSRQIFYDFNGIYVPLSEKRFALQLQGGIGGARTSYIETSTGCIGTSCVSQNQPLANWSHFQVHAGVGVSLYVTSHIFIRPQFDFHYVPGLNNQFGSNMVPQGTIWVGYAMGSRD
jgi:opacity protein-like surface antigen